ncbi:Rv1733c family protein [Mycolicibacterium litorale]|uniref:Rv1733c family protein n=1 Tax=Mycolicibacterium litorale TaxID=758802 RepID=UPI003CF52440
MPVTTALRRLTGGPLVRCVDRVEAGAALTGALLLVVAAFFAVQVSDSVSAEQLRVAEVEAANRHAVDAVALERSKAKPQRVMTTFTVHVQWTAHGVTRDRIVEVPQPVSAGDRVEVWTDAQGNAASAPTSGTEAQASGFAAGLGVWLLSLALVASALLLLRRALNRVRYRGWDRDLALLVGYGGGSTAHH